MQNGLVAMKNTKKVTILIEADIKRIAESLPCWLLPMGSEEHYQDPKLTTVISDT